MEYVEGKTIDKYRPDGDDKKWDEIFTEAISGI